MPGRNLEGALVGGAAVDRVAVRDDHVLERKLEQVAERRQGSLLMPGRRPDTQLAVRRGQRVGEDERALLGQPEAVVCGVKVLLIQGSQVLTGAQ
jgi:hypothetical protein